MSDERTWPLGVVLTITHGKFLHKNFCDVHCFTEWYVGYPVWSHQLPRVWREIQDGLRKTTCLDDPSIEAAIAAVTAENALEVLGQLALTYGMTITLRPASSPPPAVEPVGEVVAMVGPERILVVEPPDETV